MGNEKKRMALIDILKLQQHNYELICLGSPYLVMALSQ
jgi:hypothetical protein